MSRPHRLLALAAALAWAISPVRAAPIVISSAEIWDGVNNPHAAQGVTLTPAPLDFSAPAVYTIPDGLRLDAGAIIYMRDPNAPDGAPQNELDLGTPSITFEFQGTNGLQFNDPTAYFDLYEGTRNGAARTLQLNLNGKDITSIANAGVFQNRNPGRDNMLLTINGRNVTLDRIDLTRGDSQPQNVVISASGSVDVGFISTLDNNAGGNNAGNVDITASQITVRRGISTFADRTGSATSNGNITLTALQPPGFDPTSATNTKDNRIVLGGLIKTNGARTDQPASGNLTLTATQVILNEDVVLNLDESATTTINAGQVKGKWLANQLFVNNSASVASASHTTNWNGQPPGGPNDVNGDGNVDLLDYDVIRSNFGLSGAGVLGDTNFDNKVDLRDFVNWRNAFSAPGGGGNVPEPGSLGLILFAGMGAAALLRRRGK